MKKILFAMLEKIIEIAGLFKKKSKAKKTEQIPKDNYPLF